MAAEQPGLSEVSKKLHAACREEQRNDGENSRRAFFQEDLANLCDLEPRQLMRSVQELCEHALFIAHKQQSGKICWELRAEDIAAPVRSLDKSERMVFQVIEESHRDGVWIKKIKNKTGIQDNSVERMVNRLVGMGLIKCVRHVKAPSQKTYMLSHLAPGDDVTGGSFYDQGDLDETMVTQLADVIILHVRQQSWTQPKRKEARHDHVLSAPSHHGNAEAVASSAAATSGGGSSSKNSKRKLESLQASRDIEDSAGPPRKRVQLKTALDLEPEVDHLQIAYPAGHRYPTTDDIRTYLDATGLLRDSDHKLTMAEVQKIINVLIWDEKLEEINGGYRTVRGVREQWAFGADAANEDAAEEDLQRKLGNAFTEMPCGRCPVIDLCGNGGPINAESCLQFESWIKLL